MNKFSFYILIFFSFLLFAGCTEEIPVPGYIEINSYALRHENAIGITDVWVNVNGDLVGVFELPAKFPVIAEGESSVTVTAGIMVNGINATRTFYPFYKPYKKTVNFEPSKVIELSPVTDYNDWTSVEWSEGFENGHKFEKNEHSDTVFVVTEKEKFSGSFSGGIFLNNNQVFFESYTAQLSRPDLDGAPGMYIELNYKCDNPFEIGIYTYHQQQVKEKNIVRVNKSNTWKKIYIDLYNSLLSYPKETQYKVYIAVWRTPEQASASVFIDDFKIIQRKEIK
jgi:hypothetical protein